MRLLNVQNYKMREFPASRVPKYAILSHTWRDQEIQFQAMDRDLESAKSKPEFFKIQKTCETAQKDGIQFVWIDTCCIDKRNKAELDEVIGSMFHYYQSAEVCYTYLADVKKPESPTDFSLAKSRWITRGWTLQGLIASRTMRFYDQNWDLLAIKQKIPRDDDQNFLSKLSICTGNPQNVIQYPPPSSSSALRSDCLGRQGGKPSDQKIKLIVSWVFAM
jgi:Heterokaryon incompatibility protein (HET)